MSRPLTPQEIISRAHDSVSRAKSSVSLCLSSAYGAGAINCLFDLGLIEKDSWRDACHWLETLAERRKADLADQEGEL